jgi:Pyruvate/2-oxoacid:ferredoxin oxidoreductase delta subunit
MTEIAQPYNYFSHNNNSELIKKISLAVLAIGFLFLLVSLTGVSNHQPIIFLLLSLGLIIVGTLTFSIVQIKESPAGVKNNRKFFNSMTNRGVPAWIIGILISGFYSILYWYPSLIENWTRLVDPISYTLRDKPANQWFLYGTFYTVAVLVMGTRMIVKYRHSKYHIIRTSSVMFFQLGFSFLIPALLVYLNKPEFYFSYFWPLKYEYLFPSKISYLTSNFAALGTFMVFWGAVMTFIATPILTYFFGKRWYCSWVCGCGGLAETAGDPYRHLSNKSLKAWKVERWMIYSVLVFIVVTTVLLYLNLLFKGAVLGSVSQTFASVYGFIIGAVFSGVIGIGFYPIMGSRVWCRFGCPMAAVLGLQQKFFSRFRITTNGGQCISCGNCSTYCEMGIDVKWYAQRGQNIVRASCVGCGICAAVCPRGVLKLENGKRDGRYDMQWELMQD